MASIVLKLLFKMAIPLILLLGLLSYGLYMRGGDPAALFGKLAGNMAQSAKSSLAGAGSALKKTASLPSGSGGSKTQVYKWVDSHGVTQFSSAPPQQGAATLLTIDNNVNTFAAQQTPKSIENQSTQQKTTPHQAIEHPSIKQSRQTSRSGQFKGQDLGLGTDRLPGVAGMDLPTNVDAATLNKFLQSLQSDAN